MYRKEIIYIGLHRNGNRMGSAGFLKAENKDTQSRLFLKLQNIPHAINGRFPIRIYNGSDWKEMDGVIIKDGSGVWQDSINGAAEKIRLQIILPEGYLLEGQSKNAEQKTAMNRKQTDKQHTIMDQEQTEKQKTEVNQEQTTEAKNAAHQGQITEQKVQMNQERMLEQTAQMNQERVLEQTAQMKQEQTAHDRREMYQQSITDPKYAFEGKKEGSDPRISQYMAEAWEGTKQEVQPEVWKEPRNLAMPGKTEPVGTKFTEIEMPRSCNVKEDKWEQILSAYEQIHPYGDERVYVKLEPRDFIILQSKYQHLVNNSFLLHGFYNYRYVILGKEDEYYLGVPGVFYEREKMVALMFGFEAFECPGGSAKAGEFGYYLRKVEI